MTKKENTNSKTVLNKVQEPEVVYKTIRVLNSFEEMEQDELKWLASLLPEEHLQHATSLIKRVFSEQLEKHPKIGKRITFG